MLEIKHVSKQYQHIKALDDVSFTVDNSKITVLIGANGAGKSTLIKSIMGILQHDGDILLDGKETKDNDVRYNLGYVPEIPEIYPLLTVKEHLIFQAKLFKLNDYEIRANDLMKRFDLMDKKDKFGSELSKGMKQKVKICTALLPNPSCCLFDEPIMGLDPYAIKELKQCMLEIKQSGHIAFISTHIIDNVNDIWDQAIILEKGILRANVTKEWLDEQQQSLEDYFFQVTNHQQEVVR